MSVQLLDILLQVIKNLEDKKFLQWPKVYLHPTCETEAADLKAKILSLRGEILASAGELFMTHGQETLIAIEDQIYRACCISSGSRMRRIWRLCMYHDLSCL